MDTFSHLGQHKKINLCIFLAVDFFWFILCSRENSYFLPVCFNACMVSSKGQIILLSLLICAASVYFVERGISPPFWNDASCSFCTPAAAATKDSGSLYFSTRTFSSAFTISSLSTLHAGRVMKLDTNEQISACSCSVCSFTFTLIPCLQNSFHINAAYLFRSLQDVK